MYINTDFVTETKRYVYGISAKGDPSNPNTFEVSDVPPFPDPVAGINHLRFYNPETKEFWFEEEKRPLTPEEKKEIEKEKNL